MVMLSLAAAALLVADADAEVDVIRLPSDGGEGALSIDVHTGGEVLIYPWY
jgi:hypothetical protein